MQRGGEAPLWPEPSRAFRCCCSRTASAAARSPATTCTRSGCSRATATSSSRRSTATRASPTSSSTTSPTSVYALLHFQDYIAMQALRPLELRAALDALLVASRLARPRRPEPDRRVRREPRRRIGAADGRRAADDDARHVVEAGAPRPAPQGGRRLRAVLRHLDLSGVRARPAGPRQRHAAVSRDRGTADTTAPIGPTRDGMQRLREYAPARRAAGRRSMASTPAFSDDIFTWSLDFPRRPAARRSGAARARARG